MASPLITLLDRDNQAIGPFELTEVQRRLQAGEFRPNQMAHTDGLVDWAPLTSVISHCLRLKPSRYAVSAPEPEAPAEPTPVYAGLWLRFTACSIDGAIIILGPYILVAIIMLIAAPDPFIAALTTLDTAALDHAPLPVKFLFIVPLFFAPIFYFSVMESSARQATIGKSMVGLRVTDLNGQRLTYWRAFARTAAKLLSNATCLFFFSGYLMAGFTARRQALHDFIAKTLVVKK